VQCNFRVQRGAKKLIKKERKKEKEKVSIKK
jgi:hypothetical protein